MKRIWILAIILAAIGLVGGAGYWGFYTSQAQTDNAPQAPLTVPVTTCDVQQSVSAPGTLVNTHQVTVQMPTAGQLAEIDARAGEHVTQGQVLASLADREKFQAAVTSANLALLQAQQDLADLQSSAASDAAQAQLDVANAQQALDDAQKKRTAMDYSRASNPLVVENAQTDYQLAKAVYKDALHEYQKYEHKRLTDPKRVAALKALLDAKNRMDRAFATYNWYLLKASPQDIAQADAEVAVAQTKLAEAQVRWQNLQAGPDPLQLDLANAKVQDAQATLAQAQKDLENVDVRAPFDGVVLEVKASAGDNLQEGAGLVVLEDPRALEVESTVTEEDLPNVQVGQTAEVFFDAMPDIQATGTLSRIVPQRVPGDRPLYTVYLSLDHAPDKLVSGMTADASIVTAQAKNVLCLPRSVVRASSGNTTTVKVWAGDHEENVEIEVGLRGDTNIEIRSGLTEGEQVVAR
jgi:multidrug efflux pump subunit AcrA (membrane-fusion protein)